MFLVPFRNADGELSESNWLHLPFLWRDWVIGGDAGLCPIAGGLWFKTLEGAAGAVLGRGVFHLADEFFIAEVISGEYVDVMMTFGVTQLAEPLVEFFAALSLADLLFFLLCFGLGCRSLLLSFGKRIIFAFFYHGHHLRNILQPEACGKNSYLHLLAQCGIH